MSRAIEWKMTGQQETYRALGELEFKLKRSIIQKAVRQGTNELLNIARQLAPVKSGLLKKQLKTTVKTDRVSGTVTGLVKPQRTKKARSKGVKHSGHYLHIVVGGSKPHEIPNVRIPRIGTFTRVDHPGSKPRPFMDEAVNLGQKTAVVVFENKLEEELIKATNKIRASQRAV